MKKSRFALFGFGVFSFLAASIASIFYARQSPVSELKSTLEEIPKLANNTLEISNPFDAGLTVPSNPNHNQPSVLDYFDPFANVTNEYQWHLTTNYGLMARCLIHQH